MDVTLTPELQAQLEEQATRHGCQPAELAQLLLASSIEARQRDFEEALEGIRRGYEAKEAGRCRPADDFLAELRRK